MHKNDQDTSSEKAADLRHLTFDVDHARVEVERRYSGKYEGENAPATERGVYHEAARYYAVLDDSLRDLDFTEAEALLVVDALHSFVADETTYRQIGTTIADAISLDGAAARFGVDGDALISKVNTLSPGHRVAIIDAVEQFCNRADIHDTRTRLQTVGLLQS
jgi:hypothetical protein